MQDAYSLASQQPVYPAPDAFQLPNQAPVAQPAPAFTVNAPMGEKPKKKKGKGGKIAISIIAVVLVIALLGWLFLPMFDGLGTIVRFFKRTFMDPTDYIVDVEKKAAADVAKKYATAYDAAMKNSNTWDTANQTQTDIQLSDSVLALLEEYLAQEGMDLDLGWLENISLDTNTSMKDGKMSADVGVALNNAHLCTISTIWDLESQIMYIGIPELSSTYFEMDMEDVFGEDLSDLYPTMMQSQEMYERLIEAMPSGDELEDLINRYVGIVLDHVKDVEKANETVKVDGVEQKLLVMTTEFSQKEVIDIALDLLKELRDDQMVKDLLVSAAEISGEDADAMADSYTQGLDELIANCEASREEATGKKFITLETYLDSKDNIVGRNVTISAEGEKAKINYITVTKGEKFAFEGKVEIPGEETVLVTGSGTIKGGKTNGEYVLEIMGEDYLTLKVEDYSATESGTFSGTFILSPESALLDSMDLDSAVLQLIGGNVGIKISMDTTGETPSMSFGLLAGSMELFNVDMRSKNGEAGTISMPDISIELYNEYDLIEWLADADLNTLVENLEKTGIPSEYTDTLGQLAGLLG